PARSCPPGRRPWPPPPDPSGRSAACAACDAFGPWAPSWRPPLRDPEGEEAGRLPHPPALVVEQDDRQLVLVPLAGVVGRDGGEHMALLARLDDAHPALGEVLRPGVEVLQGLAGC